MTIEDSNPERRNLVVLSAGIIIYYLAGGTIEDKQLTLEIVNIQFTKMWVLQLSVWVMLSWFLFRYWIESANIIVNEFFNSCHNKTLLVRPAVRLLIKNVPEEFKAVHSEFEPRFYYGHYSPQQFDRPPRYLQIIFEKNHTIFRGLGEFELNQWWRFPLFAVLVARLYFVEANVSRNFTPMILSIIAFICLACNQLISC
ncbi:MAG TPA: hypothetical protein VL995_13070 [Cellvibrio sp.]|nr:hypothetical protein [Cellvibrio sp.]